MIYHGTRHIVKDEYGEDTKFIIMRNDLCEGIWYMEKLCGFSWTFKVHEFGGVTLSHLYSNHTKDFRLNDDQLMEIGKRVYFGYVEGFKGGITDQQRRTLEVLGVSA